MTKKEIIKLVISVLIAALMALAAGLGLSSCNVTRTGGGVGTEFLQRHPDRHNPVAVLPAW